MKKAFILAVLVTGFAYPVGMLEEFSFLRPTEKSFDILFVGDLLFDRSIRGVAEEEGADFIFSCIKDELLAHDLVVANIESPITPHTSVSMGSEIGAPENYRFTAPLALPQVLKNLNIRAVTIGNNHIFDFGGEGIDETRKALLEAGIVSVGDPRDEEHTSTLLPGDEGVALVAYNEFFAPSIETTIEHIKRYPDAFVIVFAHWGNEYETDASAFQKTTARRFAEAGADLIVGAHPHVIQESEEFLGAPIYYSLGNFIFDQYWNEEVRTGLALAVSLKDGKIDSIDEKRLYLERDRRTCPHTNGRVAP